MKTNGILLLILGVVVLSTTILPVTAIAPSHSPPAIYDLIILPKYINPSTGLPMDLASVSVSCYVVWDSHAIQKYVWLYIDSTRYTMSWDSSTGCYTKTVSMTPTAHSMYVKAREIIDYELISLESTSYTYSLAPPADKYPNVSGDSAYTLGYLTTQSSATFSPGFDWIEAPSTDTDWFRVGILRNTKWQFTITAETYGPSLDIAFTYYYSPTDSVKVDNGGKGVAETVTAIKEFKSTEVVYLFLYIKIHRGSIGGCGPYHFSIIMTRV